MTGRPRSGRPSSASPSAFATGSAAGAGAGAGAGGGGGLPGPGALVGLASGMGDPRPRTSSGSSGGIETVLRYPEASMRDGVWMTFAGGARTLCLSQICRAVGATPSPFRTAVRGVPMEAAEAACGVPHFFSWRLRRACSATMASSGYSLCSQAFCMNSAMLNTTCGA